MTTTLGDAETEVHGEPCFCELFSDLYKDIHGIRPRGDWPCPRVREWHGQHYVLVNGRWEWR